MECKYHILLEQLTDIVWNRINTHYNWDFFNYWLGDESDLGRYYKEAFEQTLDVVLTEDQILLIEKKGRNLERMIDRWCGKWKAIYNTQLPILCLKSKIHVHIAYQLNKRDITDIIGIQCNI